MDLATLTNVVVLQNNFTLWYGKLFIIRIFDLTTDYLVILKYLPTPHFETFLSIRTVTTNYIV